MTLQKLNLDSIPEEVLDECFQNENDTYENIFNQENDEDSTDTDEDKPNLTVLRPTPKYDSGLSNEELIIQIRAGINVKKNKDLLVRNNSGLVYNQARACTCNIPFQDKVQYGYEGLLRAIERFDCTQTIKFSTYATASIRQTLYNEGNDDARLVFLPRHLSVDNAKIQRYIIQHRSKYGRNPSPEEISSGTGIKLSNVKRVQEYTSNVAISIETEINNDDKSSSMTLADVIKGTSKDYELNEKCVNASAMDVIALVMNELPEEEQTLLNHVHGLNGYDVLPFKAITELGLVDAKGKVLNAHSTLHRRYNDIIEKIRAILTRNNLTIDD